SEKEEAASAFAETLAGAFKEAIKRVQAQANPAHKGGGSANTPALVGGVRQDAPPVRLLGPAECPVFRLNNFYRFHFQVQSDSSAVLHEVLRNVLTVAKPPSGVEFQVDIDPYSML
ncbi:MAG: hypothetical protein L0241_11990, partial [Planctomycetia bacterium]|nr:hypothetical protein [Planctomycetia bacterium]